MTEILIILHTLHLAGVDTSQVALRDASRRLLVRAELSIPSAADNEDEWKANFAARGTLTSCRYQI